MEEDLFLLIHFLILITDKYPQEPLRRHFRKSGKKTMREDELLDEENVETHLRFPLPPFTSLIYERICILGLGIDKELRKGANIEICWLLICKMADD